MKRTYIASTIYHIYLSILYSIRDSGRNGDDFGDNLLFLVESTPMIETLIPNLKKRFFREVYIISERREHVQALGKFDYSFRRAEKLGPYLEKKHPSLLKEAEFIASSKIYLCDTDSSKSYFFYKYGGKGLHMMEDGARTYTKRHTTTEYFLKKHLTKTPIGGGFDAQIHTIFAQFPSKLPIEIRNKAKELNIRKETALLSEKIKKEIFELFIPTDTFSIGNTNNALILTQPLSEDGVIANETVKIDIYRDVISKVPGHLDIILKTHPRETTKYEAYFTNITVLPALFPIEILELHEGFQFDQGYTLFSTALSNLEIVKERFFLGKDYLDKFTAKSTRNMVRDMVFDS